MSNNWRILECVLSAIAVSLVVYVLLALWLSLSARPEELVENYTIMIDRAYWGPPVAAGLLGATFSSALASAVGAPRILQALASHDILPNGDWIALRTEAGEPRNAMAITAGIVLTALMVRDLNAIAPLITMFFLITYTMINLVVFIEQSLGLVSFRPLLHVPRIVSFAGAAGCILAMFIVNPTFGLLALAVVLVFYGLLVRRSLDTDLADVRSGLFVSLAEWAAKHVKNLTARQERAWKPNLLIPVEDTDDLRGSFLLIENIVAPKGSVNVLGLANPASSPDLPDRIDELTAAFRHRNVFASSAVIDAVDFTDSLTGSIQTLQSAFFNPNILFLPLPPGNEREDSYAHLVDVAEKLRMGMLVYAAHSRAGLGQRETVNVWINDRSPDWNVSMDIGNLDLPLLTAYKLKRNWDSDMRLLTVVENREDAEAAEEFLETIVDLARMPDAEVIVQTGTFDTYLSRAPQADVNIFGLMRPPDFDWMRHMVETTRSSCLFARDSGRESALA